MAPHKDGLWLSEVERKCVLLWLDNKSKISNTAKEHTAMNYEEMLAARTDGRLNKTRLPIGEYYRTMHDGKYRGFIDIRPELHESILFTEALKKECEANKTLMNPHQLHFAPVATEGDIKQLEVEMGVYQSFDELLRDSPAVVAEPDFAIKTLRGLVDITSYLHRQGIRHICYSPRSVLARRGDHSVMLLSHGSFYMGMNDLRELYGDDVAYVAPEVLEHGTIDNRCDVYSIGQFMRQLLVDTDIPLEFRQVIKRATSEKPEDRYERPEDMLRAVQQRKSTLRTALAVGGATLVALICLGLYFDMMPESSPVEFVKPVPRQPVDDLIDDGFSPEELGVTNGDTTSTESEEVLRRYQAKAEEIFRKNYEKEADRILSKIYNKEHMSNSEKVFISQSESTIEELMRKQAEMGEEAGLTPERSQLIASQIIERVTNEKKKAIGGTNSNGIQK